MATWSMKDARNRLSEMLREANRSGPQVITRRGVDRAVVLSNDHYQFLKAQQRKSLALLSAKADDLR